MYLPNAKLQRLADPTVEPLSLADAKGYLRVEIDDDDTLIGDMITAARLQCEQMNDRSFITTTWQYTVDYLPLSAGPFPGFPWPFGGGSGSYPGRVSSNDGTIALPMPPLIAITSLEYLDTGGTLQTLDPSRYQVSAGTPGTIFPNYGTFFPLSQPRPAAVNIVYTAGYGPDALTIPNIGDHGHEAAPGPLLRTSDDQRRGARRRGQPPGMHEAGGAMPDFDIGSPRFDLGLMRHRVSRQVSSVTGRGPLGQNIVAWSTVGTYWARVENLTGRELVNAAQLKSTVKHKITLRVVGPISPDDRFLFEGTGRVFNVEFVYRTEERNGFYELWCSERTGQV